MGSRLLALSAVLLAAMPSAAGVAAAQGATTASGPSAMAPEWFDAVVEVTLDSVELAKVHAAVQVHKATFQGRAWTADDLRRTYQQFESRGMGDIFLAEVDNMLSDRLAGKAEALFPKGSFHVDATEVLADSLAGASTGDPFAPPVTFTFDATVRHSLEDLGLAAANLSLNASKIQTLFDVGMQLALSYPLSAAPGWNLTYVFALPSGLHLLTADGGVLQPDGSGAAWQLPNWGGDEAMVQVAKLTLAGRGAPVVSSTDAHVAIDVDMADVVGLTVPGLASGDLGQLAVKFTARVTLGEVVLDDVPALASAVRGKLPASVAVVGLNADELRLAVRDGVLPAETMARLAGELRSIAATRLAAFDASGLDLQGGFDATSMDPSLISRPLDDGPPVAYQVQAEFLVPLKRSAGSAMAAALTPSVVHHTMTFAVPVVQGLATSYRIVLPPGITLSDVQVTGARAERSSQDGRDVVVLTPQQSGATATLTIAVSGDFVLAKFWYVWALLVVGLAAAGYALWRKFGRKAPPEPPQATAQPADAKPAPAAAPPMGEDVQPDGPRPQASEAPAAAEDAPPGPRPPETKFTRP